MTADDDLTQAIDGGQLKRRAVRGAAATMASQGLKFIIRLASQIAIARLLMPADYGLIAMVAPLMALLQLVAELGLGQAVVQKAEVRQKDISALFWFSLLVNVGLAAVLALASPLIAAMYGEPRLTNIVLVFAALLPISGALMVPSAMMMRNMRFYAMAAVDVGGPLAGLVSGYWTALSGYGYWSLVIALAVESICSAILYWTFSGWRPSWPSYSREVWSFTRVGGHVIGYNLANYVTSSADAILLGMVGGKVELGLYDRAYRLVTQPLMQLMNPFSRVAIPLLNRLRDDPARYRAAYRTMLEVMLLAGLPAILFLMIYSRPLLLIVLGPNWIEVAPVVSWICCGAIASPIYASTFWLFVSQDRTGEQLKYAWTMSAVSLASFAAGLPWGAAGVAASAGLAFLLVSTPIVCAAATRVGPVSALDLVKGLAPIAAAAGLAGAALAGLIRSYPTPGIISLGAVLAVAYSVFLLGLLVIPAGRRILLDAWNLRTQLARAG